MIIFSWIILVDMVSSLVTVFMNFKDFGKKLSIVLLVANLVTLATALLHVIIKTYPWYLGTASLIVQMFVLAFYIRLSNANKKQSMPWKIKIIALVPVLVYSALIIAFAFI